MNAIDVIYNKAMKSIRHAKKSAILEQDSLRCTGLKWFMMRHK